jgi:hypothetical protein
MYACFILYVFVSVSSFFIAVRLVSQAHYKHLLELRVHKYRSLQKIVGGCSDALEKREAMMEDLVAQLSQAETETSELKQGITGLNDTKIELQEQIAELEGAMEGTNATEVSELVDYMEKEGWLLADEVRQLKTLKKSINSLCRDNDLSTSSAGAAAQQRRQKAGGKKKRLRREEDLARVGVMLTTALMRNLKGRKRFEPFHVGAVVEAFTGPHGWGWVTGEITKTYRNTDLYDVKASNGVLLERLESNALRHAGDPVAVYQLMLTRKSFQHILQQRAKYNVVSSMDAGAAADPQLVGRFEGDHLAWLQVHIKSYRSAARAKDSSTAKQILALITATFENVRSLQSGKHASLHDLAALISDDYDLCSGHSVQYLVPRTGRGRKLRQNAVVVDATDGTNGVFHADSICVDEQDIEFEGLDTQRCIATIGGVNITGVVVSKHEDKNDALRVVFDRPLQMIRVRLSEGQLVRNVAPKDITALSGSSMPPQHRRAPGALPGTGFVLGQAVSLSRSCLGHKHDSSNSSGRDGVIARTHNDGSYDVRLVGFDSEPFDVPRKDVLHEFDVRMTRQALTAAGLDAAKTYAGCRRQHVKVTAQVLSMQVLQKFAQFCTSDIAISFLDNIGTAGTGRDVGRNDIRSKLYPKYLEWCKNERVGYVSRDYFSKRGWGKYGKDAKEKTARDCTCDKCHIFGRQGFKRLTKLLDLVVALEGTRRFLPECGNNKHAGMYISSDGQCRGTCWLCICRNMLGTLIGFTLQTEYGHIMACGCVCVCDCLTKIKCVECRAALAIYIYMNLYIYIIYNISICPSQYQHVFGFSWCLCLYATAM